VYWAREVG
jgi:hypothetical protein